MARIEVTISEMQKAAKTLQSASDDFMKTAGDVLSSAEALSSTWEGDSQVAFINEQKAANQWYSDMVKLVNEYVTALYAAADEYQETDTEAAALIRQK